MLRLAGVALVLSIAAGAAAQDDPFETRVFDVEFLTKSIPDHPCADFGMDGVSSSKEEPDRSFISGEDLVALVKSNIQEDSWEHQNAKITFEDGQLTVTNVKSVQEKISQYLAYWRGIHGRMVVVDGLFVSVDPALFGKLRGSAAPNRPSILPAAAIKELHAAVKDGKAEILKALRATAYPGQRVGLQEFAGVSYVGDIDIQVATGSVQIDPIIHTVSAGAALDVRPHIEPFEGGITMEARAALGDTEALTDKKLRLAVQAGSAAAFDDSPDKPGDPRKDPSEVKPRTDVRESKIQHPRVNRAFVRTTVTTRDRETAVLGAVQVRGRVLVFLASAGVVALEDKPAPEPAFEEERLLRIYDVSPLTRVMQDFPGPALEMPAGAGGAPLTGASFALEEAKGTRVTPESLVELIRTRVAPETWGNKRNAINATESTLVVRQKPAVLKLVDEYLKTLLSARARTMTVELLVIGFKKGSRSEWEKEIPALAPGGYFADVAGVRKLLDETAKGGAVSVVESAEVTCYPQQRVHVARLVQEAYLSDYEPQVATFAGTQDPVMSTISTGFVVDVRPHFVGGTDRVAVDLRAKLASCSMREVDAPTTGAGYLQLPRLAAWRWNTSLTCRADRYTIAAVDSRKSGDDTEDLVVLVRARPNDVK